MEYKINPALIPSKCRRCLNFTGAYCDIHQHFIEDVANCSEFTDGENSQEDTRITVEHLREILMDMAMPTNEYRPEPTIARTVDEIIERVKKEI